MSQLYRGDMTFRGPALFSSLDGQNISLCFFRQQLKQVGGLDGIVLLRLTSFSTSTLQSINSEQKAQGEGDKAVIYKSTWVPAAKWQNVFPATPLSNHLPHLLIICNQT